MGQDVGARALAIRALATAGAWAEGTLPGGAGTKSAKEWAGEAEVSAATAEAAAGPTYASTAAGLAATSSGEAFAVDVGGGLVSVYLNSAGSAVLQRTLATTDYLASSAGAEAVGTAGGVTLQDALDLWSSDLGFGSLQAAVTAGAGRRVFISRSWNLTAAVTVPAGTEVVLSPHVVIAQTTNATSAFLLPNDNASVTGSGLVRGTNTEAAPAQGAIYVTGDNCLVSGVRVNQARVGIAIAGGATSYTITDNLLWGGTADGNVASDIVCYGTSGNPTKRGIISGNRCFSNSDTGINCNLLAGDAELIVTRNIVCPLNSDMTARLTNAATTRRYGIVFSYNGGVASTRIVSNNLVVGCAYAGLYGTSNTQPVGVLAFNGNIAQECGFGMAAYDSTDNGLRSGILFINAGRVVGAGNAAVDCYTTGLKIVDKVGFSSNQASRIKLGCFVSGTVDATITPAAARGVHITGQPSGIDLDLFVLHGTGATQAAVILDATGATCGDVILRGRVEVNSDRGALQITAQFGGTDFSRPVIIDGMSVTGNSQTSGEFNSGIWYQGNVHIRNFTANTFHRGVNNAQTTTTRRLDLVHQKVTLINCAFGCNGGGSGLLLVEGLVCQNVTTATNGCFVAGERATDKLGSATISFSSSLIPSTAFGALAWARGDFARNTLAASGAALCWVHNGTSWIAGPLIP